MAVFAKNEHFSQIVYVYFTYGHGHIWGGGMAPLSGVQLLH